MFRENIYKKKKLLKIIVTLIIVLGNGKSYSQDNFYNSEPYLEEVALIVSSPKVDGFIRNGFFFVKNDTWIFQFALFKLNDLSKPVSYSYGLTSDVTVLYLEDPYDKSVSWDYEFSWNYKNTYDDKTGQCDISLFFNPKNKSFNLIMRLENEVVKYSGTYQKRIQ